MPGVGAATLLLGGAQGFTRCLNALLKLPPIEMESSVEERKRGRPRIYTDEQRHEVKLRAMRDWRLNNKDHVHNYTTAEDVKVRRRAQYHECKVEINTRRRERYAQKSE